MADPLLLYGAYGYTGRLIAHRLVEVGLCPVLSGRDGRKLAAMAEELDLPFRVADLGDPQELEWLLRDVEVVVSTAGPFVDNAEPMIRACLASSTHYLDINGELASLERMPAYSPAARDASIMIMPGVGFDVVPSDCLCAHVSRSLPDADRLLIGIRGLAISSRGSVRTLARHANLTHTVRRDGELVRIGPGMLTHFFDFGDGPQRCLNVGWGDVSSAYHTTGIPTIEVYFDAHPIREALLTTARHAGWYLEMPIWQSWLQFWSGMLPEGPGEEERRARTMSLVALASDRRSGESVGARMATPEAYSLTALSAAEIVQRVLRGEVEPGFHTPGSLYGPELAFSLPGVTWEDLGTGGPSAAAEIDGASAPTV